MATTTSPHPIDRKCVYVVERDEAVRNSIKLLLELDDLRVAAFASFDAFRERHGTDAAGCALIDLESAGMPVAELVRVLDRASCRGLVIMVTGRSETAAPLTLDHDNVAFLHKPFPASELIETVRRASAIGAAA